MYQFYFGNVLLPVAPQELKLKIKNQNTALQLVSEGELNILKSPGLTELAFTLLLPSRPYAFAKYDGAFRDAAYYLSLFERLKTERRVFELTVLRYTDGGTKLPWDTNMKCALESYTIREAAEQGFDFEVEISLKQYVPYGVKTLTIKNDTATEETDRDASAKDGASGSYTVKAGDTLWDIARTQLGDGTKWKALYSANKKLLDDEAKRRGMPAESGDRWIFAGTALTIPK